MRIRFAELGFTHSEWELPAPYEHGSETLGDNNFDIPILLYCTVEIPALNRSRERGDSPARCEQIAGSFISEGPGCNIGNGRRNFHNVKVVKTANINQTVHKDILITFIMHSK